MDTIEDFYGLFNTYITFGKYFDVSQLTFRNEGGVELNISQTIAQLSLLQISFNHSPDPSRHLRRMTFYED